MSDWDEWLKKAKAEHGLSKEKIDEQKAARRLMTDKEKLMARRLKKCSLKRTTYHTRLVEALVSAAEVDAQITERMAWTLAGLYYMYRRQHGDKEAKKPDGWE